MADRPPTARQFAYQRGGDRSTRRVDSRRRFEAAFGGGRSSFVDQEEARDENPVESFGARTPGDRRRCSAVFGHVGAGPIRRSHVEKLRQRTLLESDPPRPLRIRDRRSRGRRPDALAAARRCDDAFRRQRQSEPGGPRRPQRDAPASRLDPRDRNVQHQSGLHGRGRARHSGLPVLPGATSPRSCRQRGADPHGRFESRLRRQQFRHQGGTDPNDPAWAGA